MLSSIRFLSDCKLRFRKALSCFHSGKIPASLLHTSAPAAQPC